MQPHNLGINARCSGEFKVVVTGGDGCVRQETDWNNNLLLDRFFDTTAEVTHARVGTGNTPPAVTDTTLAAPIGGVSNSGTTTGTGGYADEGTAETGFVYITKTKKFIWTLGAIVGNISEFILTNTNSSTYTAHVRSLFKDTNGDPSTISVGATDTLEIWWRVKKRLAGTDIKLDSTLALTLLGVATNVLTRPLSSGLVFKDTHNCEVYNTTPLRLTIHTATNDFTTGILSLPAGGNLIPSKSAFPDEEITIASVSTQPLGGGVMRFNMGAVLPVNASGIELPLKFLALEKAASGASASYNVLNYVTFDPPFTKGKNRTLGAYFYYTASRDA